MPFAPRPLFEWRLRTRTLALGRQTLVMGILNVTPDSFSDGGKFEHADEAIERGLQLLDQGAHLVDIGGESTRPGAVALGAQEEQARVLPVIEGLLRARPEALLSIDTYHAETARAAVEAGAQIVNDVSGNLWDEAMARTCAELCCGSILMHTWGRPQEWAGLAPISTDKVDSRVRAELGERSREALAAGVARNAVVLDPGFSFGKTGQQNYRLLASFSLFQELGFPMLGGVSRKGFLGQSVAPLYGGRIVPPTERLHSTTSANTALILAGAHILRVHDVLPALEAAAIADAILAG